MLNTFNSLSLVLIIWHYLSINAEKTHCREKERPITSEKGDLYGLVDARIHKKLVLECNYCNENKDTEPRIWYKIDRAGIDKPHEVKLDMENENELNRIYINNEHSLIIANFSELDTGLYFCLGLEQTSKHEKYNYLVDLVYEPLSKDTESGNLSAWLKYHDEYFSPINKLFNHSHGQEFLYLKERLKVYGELITKWDSWGQCEVCGRPNNYGIKKKTGFCRIKLRRSPESNMTQRNQEDALYLTVDALSCRSQTLAKHFPGISNLSRVIPDFIQVEKCEGTCNPDAEGVNKGWKVGKSSEFKYRKTFVLPEKSYLTLVCPESTLENTVVWKKSGKVFKPGNAANPNAFVGAFNTLYLVDVTEEEAGNYTCQVDDIKMQQIRIFIVTKSKIITGEFVRHLVYLGFILSLTCWCYCAGLIITWSRRKIFKGYEELKEELPEDNDEL